MIKSNDFWISGVFDDLLFQYQGIDSGMLANI